MIHESVKIRDKSQFEMKLNYKLESNESSTQHDVQTFFFIPSTLGINQDTYPRQEFFKDVQTYIRFKTPVIHLSAITKKPLISLQESIETSDSAQIEREMKLFCCIVKAAIRDRSELIKKDQKKEYLEEFITSVQDIKEQFYKLKEKLDTKENRSTFDFADEYLSLLIESYAYHLLNLLNKGLKDIYLERLLQIAKHEVEHRENNAYSSIPSEEGDNEEMVYRKTVLKKYVRNILFLDTHHSKQSKIVERAIFGSIISIATLLAIVFAFFSQHIFGDLSFLFLFALFIGYAYKDNIKEFLRLYLRSKLRSSLFDQQLNIYSGSKDRIGTSQESVDYIDENSVPDDIMKIRNIDLITCMENEGSGQTIIRYTKRIKLFAKDFTTMYKDYNIDGLTNILRFNISKYLKKIGTTNDPIYIVGKNNYKKVHAERVHHINMVIKYSDKADVKYKRFRIILNKSGIKRIEKVPLSK